MTWNMQGGNDGKYSQVLNAMQSGGVELACLQETGTLPAKYVQGLKKIGGTDVNLGTFNVGGSSRGASYSAMNFDNKLGANNRCSLAIFCKDAVLDHDVIAAPSQTLRPMIGIRIKDDHWIYCIHAPSSGSAAGVAGSMLRAIASKRTKWACFGDFNCGPDALQVPAGAVTTAGRGPTHQGGNVLDYVVACGIQLTFFEGKILLSDHYSQTFNE